ncbi:MAG: M20/M25/M40 family metallo-hydrolase [Gemmatimonadales bacterium]|nr:MAG: M20/M25/M40 family metallo-hydrolase [Gemmatimonadales bacterium]
MDPVDLTRELVAIPSPTGAEGTVVDRVEEILIEADWVVRRQPVAPGRDNLFATLDPPLVVLSTHLDVVPPHLPLREDEEWLHGRGTCDAKGIAAAMMVAAGHLQRAGERRVGLLFLVGEEDGSQGALAAAELEPRGRFLVNGEPTEGRLSIGQKGALRILLEAEGVSAHSAHPEEGRSAIHLLLDALERIRAIPLPSDPLLGDSTLNVGLVEGGVAPNVLAPSASAALLVRTVEPSSRLREVFAKAVAPLGPHLRLTFPLDIPAVQSAPLPGWDTVTVRYTSDLALLAPWGAGYQLGPGTIRVAHTDGERIRKSELREAVESYVRLCRQLLEMADPAPKATP